MNTSIITNNQQQYPKQGMWEWLPKQLRHNNNMSKLKPSVHLSHKPYWLFLFLGTIGMLACAYSIHGYVQEIFPNLQIIQDDRERLLVKRRAFDVLVMGHGQKGIVDKCKSRSLF